jgi:hypothetical protein
MAGQQDEGLREQRGVEEVMKAHAERMHKPASGR